MNPKTICIYIFQFLLVLRLGVMFCFIITNFLYFKHSDVYSQLFIGNVDNSSQFNFLKFDCLQILHFELFDWNYWIRLIKRNERCPNHSHYKQKQIAFTSHWMPIRMLFNLNRITWQQFSFICAYSPFKHPIFWNKLQYNIFDSKTKTNTKMSNFFQEFKQCNQWKNETIPLFNLEMSLWFPIKCANYIRK